ncbi:helix-turn-helix transcriptional regulator [uncultured Holdemania sp.]|uniref:helix-turn-helix domain-containing protein n=1 Tax=uncultured Holdemania sp. TaxID=527664 RepID=UPI002805B07B|nr:helix-turn-helix transcriptional regulator [uncultured Holdemania sp.]
MKLAENIQRRRKAAGWTQEQLAQKCAVSRQAVSKWEAGQSVPSLDKLRQLANCFGISVDELVQDDPVAELAEVPQTSSPSLVELDQARQTRQRCRGWTAAAIVCLIVAVGILGLQIVTYTIVRARGWEYIADWISPLLNLMLVLALTLSGSVLIRTPGWRKSGLGIALVLMVGFGWQLQQAIQQRPTTISFSADGRHQVVIKQDKTTGKTVLCRSRYGLYRREKDTFPYTVEGAMKLQWLAEDVCAITYQTINRSVHQMIATFGDRGDPISYHNMAAAITGEWSLMETNAAGWKIVADSTGIHLENGTLQEDYAYSDAVPFGTLALALCRDGLPQWTLVLSEEGTLNEQDLFIDGSLILCPVAMKPTAPLNFVRTSALPDAGLFQTPDLPEEDETPLVEAMRQTILADPTLSQPLPNGAMKLDTASTDPLWLSLLTLRQRDEGYRVNGVDIRVELASVQVLAGTDADQLVEVKTNEWAVSPGNQGAGPSGEAFTMTYKLRLMRAENAVLAALMPSLEEGMSGLEPVELEPEFPAVPELVHYFVSGLYDTTYMYINRRSPAQAMQILLDEAFAQKEASLSTDGQQALLESDGGQTLWLLYDGIAEDRLHYRFWLVRCEGPDWLHCDGLWQSEGEYTIPIREAENNAQPE